MWSKSFKIKQKMEKTSWYDCLIESVNIFLFQNLYIHNENVIHKQWDWNKRVPLI